VMKDAGLNNNGITGITESVAGMLSDTASHAEHKAD